VISLPPAVTYVGYSILALIGIFNLCLAEGWWQWFIGITCYSLGSWHLLRPLAEIWASRS
jgi:hypothetical protein